MFRSKSWFGGGLWKPKNPHSLEHLKYLYNVLSKNQTVSENNRGLLVETLRSIAEILIWGDQNDSTVFDFFLEKNMLSFFLKIMKQKCGSYVCVQLLQTLNILFENIRNETSLYYLLSNNHVNSIIVHKFDFSDEEVMAYYISFLKTLSLKLNNHTIHFFYNEHTNDFPLYTEAIKFFNNSESMVRIAVRTLTLNVYRVQDKSMLKFIRDKTAAPYFTNLVWFIGNHVLELDLCIRGNAQFESLPRLADLVAEHLDHLHYLNDILLLQIDDLNQVLSDHLLYHLLIPLYVSSLSKTSSIQTRATSKVSKILALFLLSQVFLIITHPPLVRKLAKIIIDADENILIAKGTPQQVGLVNSDSDDTSRTVQIVPPTSTEVVPSHDNLISAALTENNCLNFDDFTATAAVVDLIPDEIGCITDFSIRPFLGSIFDSLNSAENDYAALFSLCLLHAIMSNAGIHVELLDRLFFGSRGFPVMNHCDAVETEEQLNCSASNNSKYNEELVDRLICIITHTVKYESKVRVATLQLVQSLLLKTVTREGGTHLADHHLAAIEGAREENILLLQTYYKSDEMFLEIFEDEYVEVTSTKVQSVEHLLMDAHLLLPPAGSPLTGIAFDKRLPCGEVERSRRSMRVYFLLRSLSLSLRNEAETYLPLTKPQNYVSVDDNLDLNNSDIQSCVVITRDSTRLRRFLVMDMIQFILVEPSLKKMGWGVVKFVGFLQDIEVLGDKDDPRCLHITVKSSPTNHRGTKNKAPLLSAKFIFDDHIRCMAAKQRLLKGKHKARQLKLHMIARLLDLTASSPSPPQNLRKPGRHVPRRDRPLYNPIAKTLPGLAMAVVGESSSGISNPPKESSPGQHSKQTKASLQRDEEIPLGKIVHRRHPTNATLETEYENTSDSGNTLSVSKKLEAHAMPSSQSKDVRQENHEQTSEDGGGSDVQISSSANRSRPTLNALLARDTQENARIGSDSVEVLDHDGTGSSATTPQWETSFMTGVIPVSTNLYPTVATTAQLLSDPVQIGPPGNRSGGSEEGTSSSRYDKNLTGRKKKGYIETV